MLQFLGSLSQYRLTLRGKILSLPLVLDKELGITTTLLVDNELSEFERLSGRRLVRSDHRVERRRLVCGVFAVVGAAAARRPLVRLGVSTDVRSTEQDPGQYHVQRSPPTRPSAFIFRIQV